MLIELQDSPGSLLHYDFQRWRELHPHGVFLTLETRTRANLHGARCQHLGGTDWEVDPKSWTNSLTKKRKVWSQSVGLLSKWADQHRFQIQRCKHCIRDGFISEDELALPLTGPSSISGTSIPPTGHPVQPKSEVTQRYPFKVGQSYTRKDVYRILGLPEHTRGGNWDTGYTVFGPDFFVFCGVGAPGRTGQDHGNYFDGDRLIWFGKKGASKDHPSIQRMLDPEGAVYVFFRSEERSPFTFAGLAKPSQVVDQIPVKVVWGLTGTAGEPLPTQLPEEMDYESVETMQEGGKRTITVNKYERDPSARLKCLKHWGLKCSACAFGLRRNIR